MLECFWGEREKPFKSNVASCARSGRAHTCGAHTYVVCTHTHVVCTPVVCTPICVSKLWQWQQGCTCCVGLRLVFCVLQGLTATEMIKQPGMCVWRNNNWVLKFRISSPGHFTNHMALTCYRIMSSNLSALNMKRIRALGGSVLEESQAPFCLPRVLLSGCHGPAGAAVLGTPWGSTAGRTALCLHSLQAWAMKHQWFKSFLHEGSVGETSKLL